MASYRTHQPRVVTGSGASERHYNTDMPLRQYPGEMLANLFNPGYNEGTLENCPKAGKGERSHEDH